MNLRKLFLIFMMFALSNVSVFAEKYEVRTDKNAKLASCNLVSLIPIPLLTFELYISVIEIAFPLCDSNTLSAKNLEEISVTGVNLEFVFIFVIIFISPYYRITISAIYFGAAVVP